MHFHTVLCYNLLYYATLDDITERGFMIDHESRNLRDASLDRPVTAGVNADSRWFAETVSIHRTPEPLKPTRRSWKGVRRVPLIRGPFKGSFKG